MSSCNLNWFDITAYIGIYGAEQPSRVAISENIIPSWNLKRFLIVRERDSKEWGHGKLVGELHEQQLPRRLRGGEGIPPQVLICQFVFYQSSTLYLGELHD